MTSQLPEMETRIYLLTKRVTNLGESAQEFSSDHGGGDWRWRAIRGGFGCRPENLTHFEGTVGGMWKLTKKGAEMMREKEIKKGMQGVQPTPGRYRVEQDHPGHGHSGVPGRTGPASAV